jgi:glutamyl-tRNA synthetase
VYAHIPLLHGPDGKKLSKRHGAASVQEVREQGYLPEAVRNYIALLGWGYDESTTFMTTDELVERFALERVSKNPAVFDEQKLRWMNGRYMRELPVEDLHRRLEAFLGRGIPIEIVEISREKMQTLADFWPLAGTLVERPSDFQEKAWRQWGEATDWPVLVGVVSSVPDPFDAASVEQVLREWVEEQGVKPKEVFQPLRVALTGTTVSPGIFESVAALGREETLARLDKALQKAK